MGGMIGGNTIHTQHPIMVPCPKNSTHAVDVGTSCSADTGAGKRIHVNGHEMHSVKVPDAKACCTVCVAPHCATWSFGWDNGTSCRLSPAAPVSITKDSKFAGGVKGPAGPTPHGCTASCPLTQWLAEGHDLGTTVKPLPRDDVVIAAAKKLLGMTLD